MARVTITLQPAEQDALIRLADLERREPRAQAAICVRRELQRAGLLPADIPTPAKVTAKASEAQT